MQFDSGLNFWLNLTTGSDNGRVISITVTQLHCIIHTKCILAGNLLILPMFPYRNFELLIQDEFRWSVVKTLSLFAFGVYAARELRGVDLVGAGPS